MKTIKNNCTDMLDGDQTYLGIFSPPVTKLPPEQEYLKSHQLKH